MSPVWLAPGSSLQALQGTRVGQVWHADPLLACPSGCRLAGREMGSGARLARLGRLGREAGQQLLGLLDLWELLPQWGH